MVVGWARPGGPSLKNEGYRPDAKSEKGQGQVYKGQVYLFGVCVCVERSDRERLTLWPWLS